MQRRASPWSLLALAAVGAACARMAPPPGGPPDFTAPRLVATFPESVVVLPEFDGWVEFEFDEVISEGSQPNFGFGSGDLEQLVLISPDSGVPRVRWQRERIAVQPRDGWRPNTVYRIELAPGVRDIAPTPNVRDSAAVVTFTTGAPLPRRSLFGRAVDWLQRRFAPRALVEVALLPDSLVYRTVADSSGRWRIGPLPEGEYLVRVVLDNNGNRRLDRREGWDTVRVGASRDSVGEVWAFQRDTLPPTVEQGGVSQVDSFGIAINLSQPVDPSLRLGADDVRLWLAPDSTPVPVVSAMPAAAHDSIYGPIDSARRAQARARADTAQPADTARAVPDTVVAAPRQPPAGRRAPVGAAADTTPREEPREPRPRLGTRIVIRVSATLEPGRRYLIELRGVRAMGGAVADTLRAQLEIPERPQRPAADTTAADSAAAPTDTAAAAPPLDTLPARRP